MKLKLVLSAAIVLLGLVVLAWAADVSGKWIAQIPGRGGQTVENTFTFKVDGAKLTGTISGPQGENPIADGKVSGDDISFTVTQSGARGEVKFEYKGKASGNEIKFTRDAGRGPQEFTAKRATT